MARIRTIKPEFFYSETLAKVSLATERSFCGLFTHVDDTGRAKDVPAVMNGQLWPTRGDHTVADMEADLAALADPDLPAVICRYEVAGRRYLHLPSWHEHQRINKPTKSKLPPCPVHEVAAVASAAQAGPGQLPLEGETSGKSSPQDRKEGSAGVRVPGSAAAVSGRGAEGVSRVTRFPDAVSGGSEPVEPVGEPPVPDLGADVAPDEAFAQVSALEGEVVSRVTRSPHQGSETRGRKKGPAVAVSGAAEGAEEAFVQVSGLQDGGVSHVTHIPDFSRGERKGTGKGKERTPSTLRVLDARAHEPNADLTDQRGSQPTTSSPTGGNDADIPSEQSTTGPSGPGTTAQTAPANADSLTSGVAAAETDQNQEQDMSADENQGELFEAPAAPEPVKAKGKRAPNKNMTPARKEIAKAILDPWWKMFASTDKGGWGQSYGVVYSVLCSALAGGLSEDDIKRALMVLGPERKPISGGTIQFALTKTARSAEALHAEQEARRSPDYYVTQL